MQDRSFHVVSDFLSSWQVFAAQAPCEHTRMQRDQHEHFDLLTNISFRYSQNTMVLLSATFFQAAQISVEFGHCPFLAQLERSNTKSLGLLG